MGIAEQKLGVVLVTKNTLFVLVKLFIEQLIHTTPV
jgi:hypothetical protein